MTAQPNAELHASVKAEKVSPHVLYDISVRFGISYEELMEMFGHIVPASTSPSQLADRDAAVTRKALQMACEVIEQFKRGGFFVDSYDTALYKKISSAILALQPPPSRWQEVPEGSVVVPVEPDMLVYETSKDVIKMFNDGDEHQQMLYELMFSKAWRAVCRAMIGSAP